MKTRRLWTAAAIIAAAILILFVISVPRAQEVFEAVTERGEDVAPVAVGLRDRSRSGTHTLSGTVLAPDACSRVEATATVDEERITLALMLSEDVGICLELATDILFSTQVEAAAGLPVTVTVNGKEVTPEML